jgi:hypothetical protein
MIGTRSSNRRQFLADVGRGMLIAGVGLGTAVDLGLATASAADDPRPDRLSFGALDGLVGLLQETPAERLMPVVVGKLRDGTSLRDLVAAAAYANARTFGGEDYVGFHTMMALAPSFHMAAEMPEALRALPVLKVLYRNTNRMQESGKLAEETLRPVAPLDRLPDGRPVGECLRDAVRARDLDRAEATFAAIARGPGTAADDLFNAALWAVEDNTEVHRVVMPYRARDLMGLIGLEQAHALLRQSVRYCVKSEREWRHDAATDEPRRVLPALMDQYKLEGRGPGSRQADDAWVEHLARTLFESDAPAAADAAAAAVAEGFRAEDIGEAIALAANALVLRDRGRPPEWAQPGKPAGSVHGDSTGVHACDSANAWRNMALAADPRNAVACLILGAYQVARDRSPRSDEFLHWSVFHDGAELDLSSGDDPGILLHALEDSIRANDQRRAAALAQRAEELGHPARPVFDVLLRYAVSEDGALHAEKYYRTVSEEYAAARPAFRARQLAALARVTASEFGRPAPGVAEARQLLAEG